MLEIGQLCTVLKRFKQILKLILEFYFEFEMFTSFLGFYSLGA